MPRPLAAHQTPEPQGGGSGVCVSVCLWVGGAEQREGLTQPRRTSAAAAPFHGHARAQRSTASVSHILTQISFSGGAECEEVGGRWGGQGYHRVTVLCPPPTPPSMSCQKHTYPAPLRRVQSHCLQSVCRFCTSVGTTATDATAECVQPLLFLSLSHLVRGKKLSLIDISRLLTPAVFSLQRSSVSQRVAGST